jgi:hypothetical protein
MAKEESLVKQHIEALRDICNLVEGDVSAEVNALDYDG